MTSSSTHFAVTLAATLAIAGCASLAGNGKITVSARPPHPIGDVSGTHRKALAKLAAMEKKGDLDAAKISSRLDSFFQDATRLRQAQTVVVGPEAVAPDTPDLPGANAAVLSAPTFSDPTGATSLNVDFSPFLLISRTQDIYESLIPAELRFKYDALRRRGYKFFYLPMTISVDPGPTTTSGFLADVNFSLLETREELEKRYPLEFLDSTQVEIVQNLLMERTDLSYLADNLKGVTRQAYDVGRAEEKEKFIKEVCELVTRPSEASFTKNCPINSLGIFRLGIWWDFYSATRNFQDIRIFSVSPLRQFDPRRESLARRIQFEQALQLRLSGPIGQGAAAAANSAADRISRLEQNFATLSQQPLLSGYVEREHRFGWRVYPTRTIDQRGREIAKEMTPGPRGVIAILALKPKSKVQELIDAETLPKELGMPIFYEARWVRTGNWAFRDREIPPENDPHDKYFMPPMSTREHMFAGIASWWTNTFGSDLDLPRHGFGALVLRLPIETKHSLTARLVAPVHTTSGSTPSNEITSKTLLRITGGPFSGESRVVVGGKELAPISWTEEELLVAVDPTEFPKGEKSYGVVLYNNPFQLALVTESPASSKPAVLKITGAPKKPRTFAIDGTDRLVGPGSIVSLRYSGPDKLSDTTVSVSSVRIGRDAATFSTDAKAGKVLVTVPELSKPAHPLQTIVVTMTANGKSLNVPVSDRLTYHVQQAGVAPIGVAPLP